MTDLAAAVSVTFDVLVPVRDGVTLAADVYVPVSGNGSWPVLIMRTPYGKNTYSENAWSGLDAVTAARSGFIVVIQDTRGRGVSGGDWAPLTDDSHDGADTIEWAAKLPGSNGRVGMFGGSYSGHTQWQAALSGAPSLNAISPLMTWADPFDGVYTRGGATELGLALPWTLLTGTDDVYRRYEGTGTEMTRLEAIFDELDRLGGEGFWRGPAERMQTVRDHDVRELGTLRVAAQGADNVERADLSGRQATAKIPTFHTGGWFDIFLQGTLDNYRAMVAAGLQARLIVGPWSHTSFGDAVGELTFGIRAGREMPSVHPAGSWIDCQLSWLRRHLETGADGPDPGPEPSEDPPVRVFVMGRNEWRSESQWPPADAQDATWFLHGNGALSPRSPDTGVLPVTYTYDLSDPVPTVGGNTFITSEFPAGPVDQGDIESRSDVVSFTSDVLAADLEIGGRVHAFLHAAGSAQAADWVVRLCDVHPDGRSFNICDGVLRVRDCGDPGPLHIDLWSTSMVFLAGHRIRVDIANSSFPRWDRAAAGDVDEEFRVERAEISVDRDRPSSIVLPIRT